MKRVKISSSYDVEWCIKNHANYAITKKGIVINTITGNILKRTLKGYTIGYYIQCNFYSLSKLRTMLEKIPADDCPF
jgi:hypothetical protein